MDLSTETCQCVPRNLAVVCEVYDACYLNASTYDCAATNMERSNVCMP
jgi:hypothetical protein